MNQINYQVLLKKTLLIIVVIVFDIFLECGINHINQIVNVFDDYLWSGIITQSIMFIFGMFLYMLFIHKNVFSSLFPKNTFKISMAYVYKFLMIFPIVLIFIYFLVYLLDPVTWSILRNTVVSQDIPIWKIVTFEAFFPGLGEEMLYRGFLLTLIVSPFLMNYHLSTKRLYLSIILASIIFSFAHLGYDFSPFAIRYDIYQLVTALCLGAVEGYVYLKSRNLLGSILIHNISNLILSAFPLLIGYIF